MIMMVMEMVTGMCFISVSTRLVLKSLSQNSSGKRRLGWSLSFTGDHKVREMLMKHLSLVSLEARIPLL